MSGPLRGNDRGETVGIVGAGRFGTALANRVASSGRSVIVWSRDADIVADIRDRHTNRRFGEQVELAPSLTATDDPAELAASARLLVVAVASTDVRPRVRALGEHLDGSHLVVHTIGALAQPGDVRVSEVLLEETPALRIGALAGPALFRDLLAGQFSSVVVASAFDEVTRECRRLLGVPPALRIYRSHDLAGVELAAALSGAYTIAVAMADVMEIQAGPRAVLVTRGLAEAQRLGLAAGAEARTFTGLAGLGNLLVRTAEGAREASRDYQLGLSLARGKQPSDASITEGARAAIAGCRLAERLGVRMPLLRALAAVVTGEMDPQQAARAAADTVAVEE